MVSDYHGICIAVIKCLRGTTVNVAHNSQALATTGGSLVTLSAVK